MPGANYSGKGVLHLHMTNEEYGRYVQRLSPPSPIGRDLFHAFWIGGLICALGQCILTGWGALGLGEKEAATATSASLIFLGALLTGLNLYGKLAKHAGAGTLVPITGFANSIVSPAIEFNAEGLVLGVGAKMFVIAGPVIVYGVSASVVYGVIYWLCTTLM